MQVQDFEHKDVSAKKVTVEYADGGIVQLDKGMVIHLNDDPEDVERIKVTFDMIDMAPADLGMAVNSVLQLGIKLGMFNDLMSGDGEGDDV